MIIAKRDGKRYEINEADQERIRELLVRNGGDIRKAVSQQFEEKFGEPFGEPKAEAK